MANIGCWSCSLFDSVFGNGHSDALVSRHFESFAVQIQRDHGVTSAIGPDQACWCLKSLYNLVSLAFEAPNLAKGYNHTEPAIWLHRIGLFSF